MICARHLARLRALFLTPPLFLLAACSHALMSTAQHSEPGCAESGWEQTWRLQANFKSLESAAIAIDQESVFVSNVNGYSRNGEGFISRLSMSGELLNLHWLRGLNAPTGLRVTGDTLWAVDFDRIVEISIGDRAIVREFPAPDEDPRLNDLFVTDDDMVFVTGSASSSIYVLKDDDLILWRHDPILLRYANGIAADSQRVYVAGLHLVAIDRADLSIRQIGAPADLIDLEGVLLDEDSGWLISRVGDFPLVRLDDAGQATPLLFGEAHIADFDSVGDFIVAPIDTDVVAGYFRRSCSHQTINQVSGQSPQSQD